MIVIIAGGRNYTFGQDELIWLDDFHKHFTVKMVVSGGANGADKEGERWAEDLDIPTTVFAADWYKHGKSAGWMRNQEMANFIKDHPQRAVLLFPGGSGTALMKRIAQHAGISVFEYPHKTPC